MTNNTWLNSKGKIVSFETVMSDALRKGVQLHVGSDSHLIGGKWLFATVLCVYTPGSGGTFYYRREKFLRNEFKSLYDRLMKETTLSILAAEELKDVAISEYNTSNLEIVIHSDVATCDTESAKYHTIVKGYVSSMGYDILVKPNAWASSAVADKVSR
jgi:predicted RNase H-related nuclease YkuK (DUF458 family)